MRKASDISWRAWSVASFVTILIGMIATFNTGDQSPWGVEWIIFPFALILLTMIDLIPRRVLRSTIDDLDVLLPSWFTGLLWAHWAAPVLIVIPAILWKRGSDLGPNIAPYLILMYAVTGVALTVSAIVIRSQATKAQHE